MLATACGGGRMKYNLAVVAANSAIMSMTPPGLDRRPEAVGNVGPKRW
jgi:hypothetical protein